MKFGPVPPDQALGGTAVHAIRKSGLVLKKGTVVGEKEVAALKAAGISEIVVARLDPGDVGEDAAASEIAGAVAGPGVRVDRAFTGPLQSVRALGRRTRGQQGRNRRAQSCRRGDYLRHPAGQSNRWWTGR